MNVIKLIFVVSIVAAGYCLPASIEFEIPGSVEDLFEEKSELYTCSKYDLIIDWNNCLRKNLDFFTEEAVELSVQR